MASGTLGQASLAAATNTTVYTAGSGSGTTPDTFNVSMVNTTAYPIAINLAIAAAATPVLASGEYIEYQTVIPPNSVLERTGVVATGGKLVVAYAVNTGISVNIYGYEG